MRWTTHLAGGMFAATMIGQPLAGVAVAGVVSLLPDIDSYKSKIGRQVPLISIPANIVFGHRGVLHSLLAFAVVLAVSLKFFPAWVVPIAVGYLSHLILDSFTPSKVPWLWPYQNGWVSLNKDQLVAGYFAVRIFNHCACSSLAADDL